MKIEPGSNLLHYRIVEKIGEGGMGVVWKAVDTTLDREVAIKVLPPAFVDDPDRVERFAREAKLLATLHHPNIASIFGIHTIPSDPSASTGPSTSSGQAVQILAMEFVPGEDLSQRLSPDSSGRAVSLPAGMADSSGNALPMEDALDVARQIAEALEEAHERGVIHRDLKPANVKLTPDGRVKVLDFGLAKAFATDGSSPGSSDPELSQTMTSAGTRAGTILGTAGYMSPEQARGKVVDKRSDVWAFGCVLYEMLTGRKTFQGETATDVIAAIVTREPAWAALPASTPPAVVRLLRRCLEKNPLDRLRDVGEARIVLRDPAGDPRPVERNHEKLAAAEPQGRNKRWSLLAAALSGATLTLLVAWIGFRPADREPAYLSLVLPQDAPLAGVVTQGEGGVALSPDGSVLVYPGQPAGERRDLFIRPLGRSTATLLEGTEDAVRPFYSPDGVWLGFFRGNRLMKTPAAGGSVVPVTQPASGAAGWHWADDGFIYFSPSYHDAIHRVPAGGGPPERLTTVDRVAGEFAHWWPNALPGGRYLLYSRWRTTVDDCSTWRLDLRTGEDRMLIDQACAASYLPTGHLVFSRGVAIHALRFDASRGEPSGDPVVVIDDAFIDPANGWSPLSIAANGTLAYFKNEYLGTQSTPVWVDFHGAMTPIAGEIRDHRAVRISPDGRFLTFQVRDRTKDDIWIHDIERGSARRLTFDGTNTDPCWTRDGDRIVFSSLRNGPYDLYWKPLDESEEETLLVGGGLDKTATDWTPDGSVLIYEVDSQETGGDVLAHTVDGEVVVVRGKKNDSDARISPDGRWLAYVSNESGRNEVYLEAWPTGGGRSKISTEGGTDPRWAPDGRTIYYWNEAGVFAVDVVTAPEVRAGRPRRLFGNEEVRGRIWSYDLHPDGKRFVILRSDPTRSVPIEIVLNWFTELERLVP